MSNIIIFIHVSFTKLVTLNKEYQSNLCRLYIGNPACIRLVQIQHWDYKDVHVHKEHIPLLLQSLPEPCLLLLLVQDQVSSHPSPTRCENE